MTYPAFPSPAQGAVPIILPAVAAGGRLSLATGTPVMLSSLSGITTVFFTPYLGSNLPLWNGTNWVWNTFPELSQALSDTTKSPAAGVANGVYDMFGWNDGGTLRCTRGPAWTNSTTRGYTLTLQDGHYLNTSAITNGPAALRGLYVGTIALDASANAFWGLGATGASPTPALLGVWNRYNRVTYAINFNGTTATGYTYTSATPRAVRGGVGFAVLYVAGLQEDVIDLTYTSFMSTAAVANASGAISWGKDSTSVASNAGYQGFLIADNSAVAAGAFASTRYLDAQNVGIHTINALERGDGTNAMTFDGAGTPTQFITGVIRL